MITTALAFRCWPFPDCQSLVRPHTLQAGALFDAAGRRLGAARLTVVPKSRGGGSRLRTIHQLRSPAPLPKATCAACTDLGEASLNSALAHLLPLLTDVGREAPPAMATSLLGMSEAHQRWRVFVAERRLLDPTAPLSFESTDLSGCYDTISQPRLLQALTFALRLLLRSSRTPTIMYSKVFCSQPRDPFAASPSPFADGARPLVACHGDGGGGSCGGGSGGGGATAAAARIAADGLIEKRILCEQPSGVRGVRRRFAPSNRIGAAAVEGLRSFCRMHMHRDLYASAHSLRVRGSLGYGDGRRVVTR